MRVLPPGTLGLRQSDMKNGDKKMKRQVVSPIGWPPPPYPFSWGIRSEDMIYTSGATGRDVKGRVPDDIREQTRICLERLGAVLTAAGSAFEHVIKATVYLTDVKEFEAMNEVYSSFFPVSPPARTTVGVAALALPGLRVEIELVARIPG